MSAQASAMEILQEAEAKLASEIRRALDGHDYSAVAELAALSDQLKAMVDALSEGLTADGSLATPTPRSREGRRQVHVSERSKGATKSKPSKRKAQRYPRFAVDGDRIVKIGWSKKDSAEYLHKAERSAVDHLASSLRDLATARFTMDDLLPIKNGDGREIPSYQAYLVLAWFREWGAVRKEARGEYRLEVKELTPGAIDNRWKALLPLGQQRGRD